MRYPNIFKTSIAIAIFLFALFSQTNISAQQKAFPTAYGGGSYASGGRGGHVYHVTSLSDDGSEGTLRWAVNQPRPATIVFDVSGTIELNHTLDLGGAWNQDQFSNPNLDDNLTIAGQTAPIGGITITSADNGAKVTLNNVRNVIMRYIRIRMQQGNNVVPLVISGDWHETSNIIIDHCSVSFGGWAAIGVSRDPSHDITIQNCIIGESKTGVLMGDSDIATASYNLSFNGNFFYNVSHRFPNPNGNGRIDVVNNVIQNPKYRLASNTFTPRLNHINNYVASGAKTDWSFDDLNRDFDNQQNHIYTSGNIIDNGVFTDPDANNQLLWSKWNAGSETQYLPSDNFTTTMHPLLGSEYPILSAYEAYNDVIINQDKGASKSLNADGSVSESKDLIDIGYYTKTAEGEGAYEHYEAGNDYNDRSYYFETRYLSWLNSISATPINIRPDNFYVSNSHIPEVWFQANVPEGQDHSDLAPSGYTWLEEYLNQVDGPIQTIDLESVTISPEYTTIEVGATEQLNVNFNPGNATNKSGTWQSSNPSIATVDANGLITAVAPTEPDSFVTITFTADEGNDTIFASSQITVFEEALQASAGDDQSICEGESTTLIATGGTAYLWSTGETTASINVSPVQTTTYTVTVSNDAGESDTDEVTVTVNSFPTANAGDDQTICEGETVTLTASGGTSFLWNTGETTPNIQVSPASDTVYSVEVFENNCSSTDELTVFVNPAPILTVSQDINITVGESTTLTVSGASTYLWSTGETSASITVSPSQTTTYTVTGTSNTCSAQAQVTVSVGAFEADAGEDQRVCENDDYSVTLSASQGDSYLWSTGETSQSVTVSPLSTTEYTVTVTSGSASDTDYVTVFVDPNPNVNIVNGNSVDILTGDFITLSATGANTYEWNNGATQPNIAVSPSQTTTYEVRGYINDCYEEKQVTVNVYQEVQASAGEDVTICLDDSVILTASGGDEYLWNTGETTQSIEVSPLITTDYYVTVFNAMHFDEASVRVEVDTQCDLEPTESDDEISNFGMDIYPNPADRYVDINVHGAFDASQVEVYDITGKLVMERKLSNENSGLSFTKRLNISKLNSGIYILRLSDGNNEITKKLIVT